MNCICTVSSERCVEDGAATLQPEESACQMYMYYVFRGMPQATCRGQGCRLATKRKRVTCICIMSSERCAAGHVSGTGLSPDYRKKARHMYVYYVFRALCPRPRVEVRAVAVLPVPLRDLPAWRGADRVHQMPQRGGHRAASRDLHHTVSG